MFFNTRREISCLCAATKYPLFIPRVIAHFTVARENEAGVDLVLIQPFLLYYVNHVFLMLAKFTLEKDRGFYQNKVNLSLTSTQRLGH